MAADDVVQASSPSFAHELRRQRLTAGLTQRDLAARSGISARTISDLERGINHVPQRETARMLSDGLGLEPSERANFLELARRRPHHNATATSSSYQAIPIP